MAFCSHLGQRRLSGPRLIPRRYGKASINNEEVSAAVSYSGSCLITPSRPYDAHFLQYSWWFWRDAVYVLPHCCQKYQSGHRHAEVVNSWVQELGVDEASPSFFGFRSVYPPSGSWHRGADCSGNVEQNCQRLPSAVVRACCSGFPPSVSITR